MLGLCRLHSAEIPVILQAHEVSVPPIREECIPFHDGMSTRQADILVQSTTCATIFGQGTLLWQGRQCHCTGKV